MAVDSDDPGSNDGECSRNTAFEPAINTEKRKPHVMGTGAPLFAPADSTPRRRRGIRRVEIEDWIEVDGTTTYEVVLWRWDEKTIEEEPSPTIRCCAIDEAFAAALAAWSELDAMPNEQKNSG